MLLPCIELFIDFCLLYALYRPDLSASGSGVSFGLELALFYYFNCTPDYFLRF